MICNETDRGDLLERERSRMKTETGVLPQRKYAVAHLEGNAREREGERGRSWSGDGGKMPSLLTRNKDRSINEMIE